MNDQTSPQRIGDYEVLSVLGAGGMGKVYKVRNTISDRIEAMKVLLPNLTDQKDLADRFLREIKLLASLSHPNIAALRTALTWNNQLIMIMEYVEGVTLASRIEQGPIPPPEALSCIDQVLSALSYAHQQRIIHRDIKPGNMMMTPQGIVKLMDFGIARSEGDRGLTGTGTTVGSLYYMSPEQVKGEPVDARSDLYSVGVSLYEMVTGERPFQADSSYSLMAAQIQKAPRPPIELRPDLPQGVNQLILMALQKEPAKRFQSADSFRTALQSVLASLGVSAPSPAAYAGMPIPSSAAASAGSATALFSGAGPSGTTLGPSATSLGASTMPPFPSQQPQPPAVSASGQPLFASAAPPPAARVQPPPPQTRPSGARTLYVTLGAILMLAALATAGVYVPRWVKTRANANANAPSALPLKDAATPSAPADTSSSSPSASPASPSSAPADASSSAPASTSTPSAAAGQSQPQNPQPSDSKPASPSSASASTQHTASPQSTHTTSSATHRANSSASAPSSASGASQNAAPSQATSSAPSQDAAKPADSGSAAAHPPVGDAAQTEDLEKQMDQLSSRAAAAKDSVDRLSRQLSSQGLGLRGDIASAESLMGTFMSKAQAAMQSGDTKNGKKYMDLAETQVEKLEKFLGH